MKIKTSNLTGPALDWTVGKVVGHVVEGHAYVPGNTDYWFRPSTDWSQGGPIIERERIESQVNDLGGWIARKLGVDYDADGMPDKYPCGPTPLIAAMRCYVASRLGDEVEVPDALIEGE